jgi:hypothetical protein
MCVSSGVFYFAGGVGEGGVATSVMDPNRCPVVVIADITTNPVVVDITFNPINNVTTTPARPVIRVP